jgi:arylformamidase
MTWIDISPPLDPATWVWPGDTPLERRVLLDRARGDSITLSTLTATVHLGAHADAFSHVAADGPAIDAHPLEPYVGPCEVVRVEVPRGTRVTPDLVRRRTDAPRLLLRTGTFGPSTDFASLSPDLVHALADSSVTLIGIDTPSIDPFDSKALEAHHACIARRVSILEGLVIDHVPPGPYELIALPLRLVGFDASPVRAVLRPLEGRTP